MLNRLGDKVILVMVLFNHFTCIVCICFMLIASGVDILTDSNKMLNLSHYQQISCPFFFAITLARFQYSEPLLISGSNYSPARLFLLLCQYIPVGDSSGGSVSVNNDRPKLLHRCRFPKFNARSSILIFGRWWK